jgi:hypothetical protein
MCCGQDRTNPSDVSIARRELTMSDQNVGGDARATLIFRLLPWG